MSTSIPLSGQHHERDHPELENHAPEPKGVIRRNLKMQVYLGIAVLFIIATAISSLRHKPATKQQGHPPTPMVQDSNANIKEMKRSLEAQQRQAAGSRLGNPTPEMATPSQPGVQPYAPGEAPSAYPCVPGQPCVPPGQAGDKVNNHYFQIFGSSIALGIIAGAAEVSNSGGALTGNGTDAYKYGVSSSLSQSATTILDQFINIPPTITIREGHRVKVYISQDLLLPAYENHTIPSTL